MFIKKIRKYIKIIFLDFKNIISGIIFISKFFLLNKKSFTFNLKILFSFIKCSFFNFFFLRFRYRREKKNFIRKIKSSYKFSTDWFTNNIVIWEFFFSKLKKLKKYNILEIGSFEGMSTLYFNLYFREVSIYCVETFFGSDEHKKKKISFQKVKTRFHKNTKNFKNLKLFETTSDFFFEKNKLYDFFDIIYIDGSHHYENVFNDAINSFNCAKKNSIIIFDDFLKEYYVNTNENVIAAVLKFCEIYKNQFKILWVGYQFIIKKV